MSHYQPNSKQWLHINRLRKDVKNKLMKRCHGYNFKVNVTEEEHQRNFALLKEFDNLSKRIKYKSIIQLDEELCDFILDYTTEDHEETPYIQAVMELYEEVTSYRV